MKTLFVSDLDGTLLHTDETTSTYTNKTLNELMLEKEMVFSYATARSYQTASKVTKGLYASMPVIVYNGAFILDAKTKEIMVSNYFMDIDIQYIKEILTTAMIEPIVYSYLDGKERFSYRKESITKGATKFINTRKDKRNHPVDDRELLYQGDVFYFTCIDTKKKLFPIYQKLKNTYHCIYHQDIYTHNQWLEILPKKATKANAIMQLKEYLQCDKVIVFGDGENDIDMFEIADESYAVANAIEELKAVATEVIDSNNEDGVAKWLVAYFKKKD